MNPTFAIDAAKLMAARDIPVGTLFCLVRANRMRGLCLRAKVSEVPMFLPLGGADRFSLDQVAPQHYGVGVETGPLHFRLSDSQPDAPDESKPGCLIISETGVFMTVRLDGAGGSYQTLLLGLSDGILQKDFPSTYCAVENWQMISRAANGVEKPLFAAGSVT
jgi:hypothetical protein